jgi:disulfide bond formation protein DsbB
MKKQRKHYIFMATIMMFIALIANFKFDMQVGYYWLIPCLFGFIGGVYIYAAIKTTH